MIRRRTALALALVAPLCVLIGREGLAQGRSGRATTFRVMTFNIRYDFPNDGPNRWPHRLPVVAKVIRESGAAVIGLQEDKGEQIDDLRAHLPGYEFLGRGRNATGSGERCAIVVKTDDVRVRDSGDVWLSDTPDVPGSNTWGDRYPRKFTWALLEVKRSKTSLLVLNTHLPERDDGNDPANRVRGARLMREWLDQRVPSRERDKVAVLVLGDYNSQPDDQPRALLAGEGSGALRDAFVEARAPEKSPGTVNPNFSGARTNSRIDWILLGGPMRARGYQKIDEQVDGRWPSDHYPVMADVELR